MDVEIVEAEPLPVACVTRSAPMEEISAVIPEGFGAVMTAIDRAGLTPTGPPLIVYGDMVEGEPLEMVIAVPVGPGVTALEGADVKTLPGGTVATATYTGPYAGLGGAYREIMAAIDERGVEVTGGPREIYVDDPDVTPQSELRTRIEFPVAG